MTIPGGLAAELALTQQAVTLSVMKQNMDMQQKMVEMIAQSVEMVPVSASRGASVNISA